MLERTILETPIGPLQVVVRAGVLCLITFVDAAQDDARATAAVGRRFHGEAMVEGDGSNTATSALRRYFAGDLAALDSVAADPGGTPFQAKVWHALREVPPGRTISYAELARRVGAPNAVRAVGAANGANPIPIVIPCHRVIGTDGKLVGYGGGLSRKEWLLRHEGIRDLLTIAG